MHEGRRAEAPSGRRLTCLNRTGFLSLINVRMSGRPVFSVTAELVTKSDHRMPRMQRWHCMSVRCMSMRRVTYSRTLNPAISKYCGPTACSWFSKAQGEIRRHIRCNRTWWLRECWRWNRIKQNRTTDECGRRYSQLWLAWKCTMLQPSTPWNFAS